MSTRSVLDFAATVLLIAIAIEIFLELSGHHTAAPPAKTVSVPTHPITIQRDLTKGSLGAKAVLVEFSDFQCPFCRTYARDILPAIVARYVDDGRLAISFRHFPNERIHSDAYRLSHAAACAAQQRLFWQAHDLIFGARDALDTPTLRERLSRAGLRSSEFDACMDGDPASIDDDIREGQRLKILGTPAFFIGTFDSAGAVNVVRTIEGAQPPERFFETIDQVLAHVGT